MKVVLLVRVGVFGVDSSTDTTGHDDVSWFWSALSSGFIDGYFGLNIGHIYPVLICLLDVKSMAYHFQHSMIWNESCSCMGVPSPCTVV